MVLATHLNFRISHYVAPSYGRPEQSHLAHCILGRSRQPNRKWESPGSVYVCVLCRAVVSLTIPRGQDFHFLHFSSNFDQFLLYFLKFCSFSSSFWLSGWANRPPGKALATLLVLWNNAVEKMIVVIGHILITMNSAVSSIVYISVS